MRSRLLDRRRLAQWYLIGAACLVPVLACPATTLAAQERPLPTQNAMAGARVFGSEGCVKCHAIDGLGGTEGPDLASFPTSRTFYDLAAAMWNHLPAMVTRMRELGISKPHLSERETGDLIAFLFSLNYFDTAGDTASGRALFDENRCILCHQVGGVGGVVGPNLSISGTIQAPIEFATAMWNHGPAMSEAMQARGVARPRFTGSQLRDLIAYIKTDKEGLPSGPLYVLPGLAGEGRQVFVEKTCNNCHDVEGLGAHAAPDLADRGVSGSLLTFAAAMWNKAPAMTASMRAKGLSVPSLTPTEMADLVGYLYSVKYFTQSGDARRGRQRVRTRGCLACHTLDGRGTGGAGEFRDMPRFTTPAAITAALWNHVLLGEQGGTAVDWPVLKAGEIADLAAFLMSLSAGR
ncbi:MAG: cytochrome c [Gemmatimonadota bacterium]|nr:cytochrome c [Gemmatimonadota bacterium]MDH3368021.1 cytochrome c [Gemmatimonadota bacterium]MDH3478141.1 cytochrome c [Gemmatimonadota bacterium]MDH5550114.1 cytochrome c [Gemmatimonadota bacterium]